MVEKEERNKYSFCVHACVCVCACEQVREGLWETRRQYARVSTREEGERCGLLQPVVCELLSNELAA